MTTASTTPGSATPAPATPAPATPGPASPLPRARFRQVCLDANDVGLVAGFWAQVLGRVVELDADGDARLRPAADGGPDLCVLGVPEPKTAKDRVHLDVTFDPGQEVTDLLALGASVVTAPHDKPWWVLADPEGHEFCAFPADSEASNDADAEVPG